jgi:hypothetical protein
LQSRTCNEKRLLRPVLPSHESQHQYFSNKAAILFRLQSDEWLHTTQMSQRILQDFEQPPLTRLRTLVLAFIRSECDEA